MTVADIVWGAIVQPLHRRDLRQARVGPCQGQGQASQPGQEPGQERHGFRWQQRSRQRSPQWSHVPRALDSPVYNESTATPTRPPTACVWETAVVPLLKSTMPFFSSPFFRTSLSFTPKAVQPCRK